MDEKTVDDTPPIGANYDLPFNVNRHERRMLEVQYRRNFGKAALDKLRAERKDAMAKAKGEGKE